MRRESHSTPSGFRPKRHLLHVRRLLLTLSCLTACTDAGLYAVGGRGPSGPDRAELAGRACVPLAAGDAFPVKVLYAVQGGQGVDRLVTGQVADALQSLGSRFSVPYIKFSLVAYHTVATGLQGSFVDAASLQAAAARYASYQEAGPISLRAPLKLAQSILSGDMQTGCKGLVARSRYLVVLVFASPDQSCANPAFNAGLDGRCTALAPDACSECELLRVTSELKALEDKYNVGEVTIQPIYVRTAPDASARLHGAAIARGGGTELIETDPANLTNTLNSLNYASLQRALTLKRLIAMNRNAHVRAGKLSVDSDGDGVPDDEEQSLGLDATVPDSDGDGLMDGLERKVGMRPEPGQVDQVNGCNVALDTDGDRLNDCEERVLGTDACVSDTDGDGIPELVELLMGTNPLIAEDLNDTDGDGLSNVGEVEAHTDASSADIAFRAERGYGYSIRSAEPTEDGRACYDIEVYNIGLVSPLERPNAPYPNIPRGTNDIYLYLQVGRENDPRGTGIGSLLIEQIQFIPPNRRKPRGTIAVTPDQFVLGS